MWITERRKRETKERRKEKLCTQTDSGKKRRKGREEEEKINVLCVWKRQEKKIEREGSEEKRERLPG